VKTVLHSKRKPAPMMAAWFLALALPCVSLATTPPATKKEKPQISQAQAEELFQKVKEILQFASDDTGLAIHHPVERKLASREQVEQNFDEQVKDDKAAQKLARSEIVMKKFGLLPRDYDLKSFLEKAQKEQVLGFYRFSDHTMYLLDWVPPQAQLPVMAHELTHALQDQAIDLGQFLQESDPPKYEIKETGRQREALLNKQEEEEVEAEIRDDERVAARDALLEGQSEVVMIDYVLKSANQTNLTNPGYVEELRAGMQDPHGSQLLATAPKVLQEGFTFPYYYGTNFVRELLVKGGKPMAYGEALKRPPETSRQLMEPKTYLGGEKLEQLHLPPLRELLVKRYEKYDVGAVGEFDVKVMLEQFSGTKTADKLAKEWRGGAYYAARIRNNEKKEAAPPALRTQDVALFYLSRWSSAEVANRFAAEYAATLPRRYKSVEPVRLGSTNEKLLTTRWLTEEGPVLIEAHGDEVLALESFDPEILEAVRKSVFASH